MSQINELLNKPIGGYTGADLLAFFDIQKHEIIAALKGEQRVDELPEFMSRHQVKDFLNVSIATVDNWTRQGILKKHFVGGVPRFKRDEVRKVFASL